MTLAADTPVASRAGGLFTELARVLRRHLPRSRAAADDEPAEGADDAVLRALCHDMRSPLASLETALRHLSRTGEERPELLALARAQTAHLASMLRTAAASGGLPSPRSPGTRPLAEVLRASAAASGLPSRQLTVVVAESAADVTVADARVQRILTNLLENAHRHGDGAPALLSVTRRSGWVHLALTQTGVPTGRVVGHLRTTRPPLDLTGLGLWSVQRQTRELGGQVVWEDDGTALTLTVQLPDR